MGDDGWSERTTFIDGLEDGARVVGLAVRMLGCAVGVKDGLTLVLVSEGAPEGLAEGAQPKLLTG